LEGTTGNEEREGDAELERRRRRKKKEEIKRKT